MNGGNHNRAHHSAARSAPAWLGGTLYATLKFTTGTPDGSTLRTGSALRNQDQVVISAH